MNSKQKEKKIRKKEIKKGFSSIENLLSFSLSIFLILASFEFLGFARKAFFKLKQAEEIIQAVLITEEKMKADFMLGGQGLLDPIRHTTLKGIEITEKNLVIKSLDKNLKPLNDLNQGQINIPLVSTGGLKLGVEICISDPIKSEVKYISTISGDSIILASPLQNNFNKDETQLYSVKKISLFLDEKRQVIRRKVNNGSAQPLLEEVISCDFHYDDVTYLLSVSLIPKSEKEKKHEFQVFIKNCAFVYAH